MSGWLLACFGTPSLVSSTLYSKVVLRLNYNKPQPNSLPEKSFEVVETLLEHGARMEAESRSGWTSLSLAVSFDHPQVVHALLRAHPLHDPWALSMTPGP